MLLDFLNKYAFLLQQKIFEHIALTAFSLLIAATLAIPLGVGLSRVPLLRKIMLSAGSISQTIPCLAMLGLLIPTFGLGNTTTIIVLVFYAIYPILKNTYLGLTGVPTECVEAAEGLGFSAFQKLWYVELPLALPVIISGLRVATSMTIGITSIAALVGAGGLGDFIMQGLSLNNPSLILLGAIPAAILALVFDYAISRLEIRLQNKRNEPSPFFKNQKAYPILLSLILFMGGGVFCYKKFTNKKTDFIVIASKNFTESFILSEMMAQLIEDKSSLTVIRKFNLGTTAIIHQAMLKKEVDLYPEYTGTAYLTVLKNTLVPGMGSLFHAVQLAYKDKFNFIWLKPFGFSNFQAVAINKGYAEKHHLHTLSDLTPLAHTLTIASPPEFLKRPDALPGLVQAYGLAFKNILQVDPSLMYPAIKNKKADMIVAFSTDGKLQDHNLRILVDDKNAHPSYEAAAIIRHSILEAHPEIYRVLSPLFGFINEEKMIELNYRVDVEGLSPEDAVRQFLKKFDLI